MSSRLLMLSLVLIKFSLKWEEYIQTPRLVRQVPALQQQPINQSYTALNFEPGHENVHSPVILHF